MTKTSNKTIPVLGKLNDISKLTTKQRIEQDAFILEVSIREINQLFKKIELELHDKMNAKIKYHIAELMHHSTHLQTCSQIINKLVKPTLTTKKK